jgi:hypothetical protein
MPGVFPGEECKMNWREQAARAVAPIAAPVQLGNPDAAIAAALTERLNDLGRDASFARSLLAGFAKYGSFTERQRPHAQRLAFPKTDAQPATADQPAPAPSRPVAAAIAALLGPQGFARLTVGPLQVAAKNDFSCAWVKWDGQLVARLGLPDGTIFGLPRHAAPEVIAAATSALLAVESDPLAALKSHGIATGRCGCCSRPLTDPTSIAIGIGPICLERMQ